MDLSLLLATPPALPSWPRAVALLLNELAQEEPSLRRLNQLFGMDPALAGRLLEAANNLNAPLAGRVSGVSEALMVLSRDQMRDLVARSMLGTTARSVPGLNLQHFWAYSQYTAKIARSLAGRVQHNQLMAYTAGLLHGLGAVVLHRGAPEKALSLNGLMPPLDIRRARLEQRVFGMCFSEVSGELAQRWGLPSTVVETLRFQHSPFESPEFEPLAAVVHLAVWRARAHMCQLNDKALAVTFPAEVALPLGLDIDMVLQQDPIDWLARPDDEDED